MKTFKRIVSMLLAALAMLACVPPASAGELHGSVGITRFTVAPNGRWYQKGFDYSLKMTSPSVGLKYFTNKSEGGWQIGAGYNYIGRASSSALAVASDANYNKSKPLYGCNGDCWPLSHWYGKGDVQGVSVLARKNFNNWFVEGGVMLARARWSVHIPDWIPCATCAPQDVTATHKPKLTLDPTIGFGYRSGAWSVGLSIVPTHAPGDEFPAIYRSASPIISISYILGDKNENQPD